MEDLAGGQGDLGDRLADGLGLATATEQALHLGAHVGGALDHVDAGRAQGRDLVGGGALAAADDGAGVAHALAGRGGAAGDEGGDRLGHVLLDEGGGVAPRRVPPISPIITIAVGLGVGLEELQARR